MSPRRSQHGWRWMCAIVAVVAMMPGLGSAHGSSANGFSDGFNTNGPLPGNNASQPWEIRNGKWDVQPGPIDLATGTSSSVLVQSKLDTIPNEPIVFVREHEFRSFTAEVTAAFTDNDTTPGTSVGMVFRAPVFDDGSTDVNNMYFFGASITGPTRDFPTGKVFTLWKRFGRSWFMLTGTDETGRDRAVDTWADLTTPHVFKVVMAYGRIQAFVDGRQIIEHRDFAAGDNPTAADPLPGLPYEAGTVGLRTTGARAWFDNFSVVGNDAYEGRATVADLFTSAGVGGQTRRGVEPTLSASIKGSPANKIDTWFQYHDHDFDSASIRPTDEAGTNVSTSAEDGVVTSVVSGNALTLTTSDPDETTTVQILADSIQAKATASCDRTTSETNLENGTYYIRTVTAGGKVTEVGPAPIRHGAEPNTVLYENTEVNVRITAHRVRKTTMPQRIESTALLIEFLPGTIGTEEIRIAQVPGGRVAAQNAGEAPVMEIALGRVVAGRYCP